jgi:hypothetical protein
MPAKRQKGSNFIEFYKNRRHTDSLTSFGDRRTERRVLALAIILVSSIATLPSFTKPAF